MNILNSFRNRVFSVSQDNFEKHALELFLFQSQNNPVYKQYIQSLNREPQRIDSIKEIPFLPIEFFKHHKVKTLEWEPEVTYESSGTGNQVTSKHYLDDVGFYNRVALEIFNQFYGNPKDFHFLALLPSYLERNNASLVAMVKHFIDKSKSSYSGFYLDNQKSLVVKIKEIQEMGGGKRIFLIGVTFALLDLSENYQLNLKDAIVMETGGMKGRREEMIRKQVHQVLQMKFNCDEIHSEYGMTELLSQAYAKKEGVFITPPWMKVLIRDLNDPFSYMPANRNGGINIIDLANTHSCAFIETSDIGISHGDNKFEVLGRFDNTDIRGCNLMVF